MWFWLFAAAAAVFLTLAEKFSLKEPGRSLKMKCRVEERLVEPGAVFSLTVTAENRRRIPFSSIRICQSIPDGIRETEGTLVIRTEGKLSGANLKDTFYLPGMKKIRRTYRFTAEKRGCFRLGILQYEVGDFLNLKRRMYRTGSFRDIIVMPKRAERREIPKAVGGLMGDISVRRFIMEDPVLVAGFADYTGREPQKDISWSQTLRAGRMIVKKYDFTAENSVAILLDLQNACLSEEDNLTEECFSLTRTVCEEIEKSQFPWSFSSDANLYTSLGKWTDLGSGKGKQHLNSVLEGLGRADGSCSGTLAELTERIVRGALHASGYLIVAPRMNPDVETAAKRIRNVTGNPVTILYAEGGMKAC